MWKIVSHVLKRDVLTDRQTETERERERERGWVLVSRPDMSEPILRLMIKSLPGSKPVRAQNNIHASLILSILSHDGTCKVWILWVFLPLLFLSPGPISHVALFGTRLVCSFATHITLEMTTAWRCLQRRLVVTLNCQFHRQPPGPV